jgi:hypothetical protein
MNPYHYEIHLSSEEFAQLLQVVLAHQHGSGPYVDMRLNAALSAAAVAKGSYDSGKMIERTGPCALCNKPIAASTLAIVPWDETKRAHAACASDRDRGLA